MILESLNNTMIYIDAIKGVLIALVLAIVAVIFIPVQEAGEDVTTILTISTFLFAIIAGFFIARLNKRYDSMREFTADEDSYFLSLFKTSKFFGPKIENKIKQHIDDYYVIVNDYELGSYKPSAEHLHAIYDELNKVELSKMGGKAQQSFDGMLDYISKIEVSRNKSSVIFEEKLSLGQWLIMIILTGIIVYSQFVLRVPELYSHIITVLLTSVLVLILLMMRDLQKFRLNGELLLTESGEEIFDFIKKPRYYHQKYIREGTTKVPSFVKEYRLGTHEIGEKPKIKLVKNKNYRAK